MCVCVSAPRPLITGNTIFTQSGLVMSWMYSRDIFNYCNFVSALNHRHLNDARFNSSTYGRQGWPCIILLFAFLLPPARKNGFSRLFNFKNKSLARLSNRFTNCYRSYLKNKVLVYWALYRMFILLSKYNNNHAFIPRQW